MSEVFFGAKSCKPQISLWYNLTKEKSTKKGERRKGEKAFLDETIVRHQYGTTNLKKRQNMNFLQSCQETSICHKDFLVRVQLSMLSGGLASPGENSERHMSCLCSMGLDRVETMARVEVTVRQ